ncbi:MAG: hypothetical protein M3Q30_09245 [Actinomycetota bacterium]|nr:hypothetical protein [Actinomycetota bacterium]
MDIPLQLIDDVEATVPDLLPLPGITGIGIGLREDNEEFFDELAVRILVSDATNVPAGIPNDISGFPICIVEFPIEPLFTPDTTRYTNLPGGSQIEQAPLAAGTLGAIVQDQAGKLLGLTNHHVAGDPGTMIWQPTAPQIIAGSGPPDLTDAIGEVVAAESPMTQTIPVPSGPELLLGREIDAATISLDEATNQGRTISDAILDNFGVITATTSPTLKMFIKKRGSQTGPTSGFIAGQVLVSPFVFGSPPPGHSYVMSRSWEIFYNPAGCPDGIISRGGDSGALVLRDGTQTAVGLLWGGNPTGGHRAMMCDITKVEERLGVTVAWSAP